MFDKSDEFILVNEGCCQSFSIISPFIIGFNVLAFDLLFIHDISYFESITPSTSLLVTIVCFIKP